MFTGIIQGTGKVVSIEKSSKNRSAVRLSVDLGEHSEGLLPGQSVALNGVCLTVTEREKEICTFEVIEETVSRTGLGTLGRGSQVNVERSLKVGERLEGHFVLGHVDGIGIITAIQKMRNEVRLWFRIPDQLTRHIVEKGSIAIDGISLTVAKIEKNHAMVCIIPHTMRTTNLRVRKVGGVINIETDILGKYILKES